VRTRARALLLAVTLLAPADSAPPARELRAPHLTSQGRHETLLVGRLFIPQKLARKKRMPLLVHFHGAASVVETAAAQDGRWAVISVETGEGSDVYARQFSNHALFGKVLEEATRKTGIGFGPIMLSAWSAGHGAIREILEVPAYYRKVDKVLLIDGLHTDYSGGKSGTSRLEAGHLQIFLKFARDSVANRKSMLIVHSEIVPGAFASTTETADWLLANLRLMRRRAVRPGPMGLQEMSEVRSGKFRLIGYAGNSAADHLRQFESLPSLMRLLR
jgi:hypothetical protein